MGLFILFNSLQIYFESLPLFNIGLDIILEMLLLGSKFLKFLLQEAGQLLLTPLILIDQPGPNPGDHTIQLPHRLIITPDQFLPNILKLLLKAFQQSSLLIPLGDFGANHLFGRKERLILLDEHVARVVHDALHADVFAVGLAEEFVGLVVIGAEFVVFAHVPLLAR